MRKVDASALIGIEAAEARVQKFLRNYDTFLRSSLAQILKGLQNKEVEAAEAAKILNRVREELERLGLDRKLAEVEKIYTKELVAVRKEFEVIGLKNVFTDADAKFAETLVTYDVSAIKTRAFLSADELKSAVMRQVISGQQVDVVQAINDSVDSLTSSTETELRTAVSGFHQSVTNAKAAELDITLMAYIGPDDGITRDFCAHVIEEGRVFTVEEIKAMDNEQDLPVEIYGGGYNCRHQWVPITEEMAKEEFGYGG